MSKDKYEYYINYRKSNYTQLSASIRKDTAAKLKDKLKKDKLNYSTWLKNKIDEYLQGDE